MISYTFQMTSPMSTTSEAATMLTRINLTIAGIVFSVMMATMSRMLKMKTGMRKNRTAKKLTNPKESPGFMELALILLLTILYNN